MRSRPTNPRVAILWLAVLVSAAGCASSRHKELTPSPEPAPYAYRIGPEDILNITFFYFPNLDMPNVRIPPDGKISLPLVGFVQTVGKTPEELQEQIHELYQERLNHPEVSVSVVGAPSQQVFIGGEVQQAKLQPFYQGLTLNRALQRAGGERRSAKKNSVLVFRGAPTERKTVYRVDLTKIQSGEMEDIYLQPYDVVVLPRKFIHEINEFVRLYIDGVIPKHVSTAFGFGYPLKGTTSNVVFDVSGIQPANP